MADQELPAYDRLQLRVNTGEQDEQGRDIYRNRTYNSINPTIDSEHLHKLAEDMGALMDDTLTDIYRHKTFQLVELP